MACRRIASPIRSMISELRLAYPHMADVKSVANFAVAVVAYRIARVWPGALSGPIWSIKLKNGITVSYRCNRGDIQGIREVILEECYRIPVDIRPSNLVDLGANIGLTTLYYHNVLKLKYVVAVEPSRRNVTLMRKNFLDNGVMCRIVEAAVAEKDGIVSFVEPEESNLGFIGPKGRTVTSVTMDNIINMIPDGRIDLLKMDIEGYEKELLTGDIEWLDKVKAIIAEFHFGMEGNNVFIDILKSKGFMYFPPKNRNPNSRHFSDFFLKK